MSDTILGQVGDSLKDIVKDIFKQMVGAPSDAVKTAAQQTTGKTESPDDEAKKQQTILQEKTRLAQIETEMAQIASQNAQKTGPEIPRKETAGENQEDHLTTTHQQTSEAVKQAETSRETGRNFKG